MDKLASPDVYQLLRHFRHDLLNDLQMLLGHLQLGRDPEVITDDAYKMVARIRQVSDFFACQDEQLATLLWHWYSFASFQGIAFSYEIAPGSAPLAAARRQELQQLGNLLLDRLSAAATADPRFAVSISATTPQLCLKCTPLALDLAVAGGWKSERTEVEWRFSYVH